MIYKRSRKGGKGNEKRSGMKTIYASPLSALLLRGKEQEKDRSIAPGVGSTLEYCTTILLPNRHNLLRIKGSGSEALHPGLPSPLDESTWQQFANLFMYTVYIERFIAGPGRVWTWKAARFSPRLGYGDYVDPDGQGSNGAPANAPHGVDWKQLSCPGVDQSLINIASAVPVCLDLGFVYQYWSRSIGVCRHTLWLLCNQIFALMMCSPRSSQFDY